MRRKSFSAFIMLTLLILVSGCNVSSESQIKADYFDIGYGQSLYEGYGKVDSDTVQSMVNTYNRIKK